MKKIIYIMYMSVVALLLTTACSDDHDDVRPGLYVESEFVETFPGDTVLMTGTVSNYIGISSIRFACDAWKIDKVIDLAAHNPKVFNYEYQLIVPDTATFEQTMDVVVYDKNGLENRKVVLFKFLPDMTSPVVANAPASQVSVDFDTSVSKATWNLNLNVSDDRALNYARIQVPAMQIDEQIELNGRSGSIERTIDFNEIGTFPVYISVVDKSGNQTDIETEVIAMLAEDEDPIADYAQMYVVDASENADDYIDGYYRYMDRMGEYQYQGKFYASTDNAKMLFTPTKSLNGDLYGASPYAASKLLNKNGYVVPVTIDKKGYYGVWVDLQTHTVSTWSLDIDNSACTEPLWMSGTGFGFADWAASDQMTKTDTYRYEVETTIKGSYAGDRQYYFYTDGWARVFRADVNGCWWFESASGSCIIFKTDYSGKVKVTFDTAAPWATIKKVSN